MRFFLAFLIISLGGGVGELPFRSAFFAIFLCLWKIANLIEDHK